MLATGKMGRTLPTETCEGLLETQPGSDLEIGCVTNSFKLASWAELWLVKQKNLRFGSESSCWKEC